MTEPIRKVAWLHVADRRLLCVRSEGSEAFYVPGGKPKSGEAEEDALVREIGEELAVAIDPATLVHVGRFTAPADGKPGMTVAVEAFTADHSGTLAASGEIAEFLFLTSDGRAEEGTSVSAVTGLILHHLRTNDVID
jgi:ADP-ribose pyrophosphatase YjhB (NUDIX family)